jgi:hypothetical protein
MQLRKEKKRFSADFLLLSPPAPAGRSKKKSQAHMVFCKPENVAGSL